MNKCNLLVLCYFHNEGERLLNSIVSVLNQEKIDLHLLLFDNKSDDVSKDIAIKTAINNSRVTVIQSKVFLPVTDSWFTALNHAFEKFDFNYLMLIGGDDQLQDKHALYRSSQKLTNDYSLDGVLPIFNNQFGKSFKLNVSRIGLVNRFKLIGDWQFAHAIFGLYRRAVWSEILHIESSLESKKVDSDWWVALFLLKFKVVTLEGFNYYKYLKQQSYTSGYYTGDDFSQSVTKISLVSKYLTKKHFTNILKFNKTFNFGFYQLLNATISHFNSNKLYLKKHFRYEYLIYPIVFFLVQVLKKFKFKMFSLYANFRNVL